MRVPLFKRCIIALLNVFFPPLAVLLLCGPNQDLFFNCILFLLAVVPSHIHGFYISWTYFNRKRKVRRGVYPGGEKSGIWSEKVNTGGVGWKEVERLKREKEERKRAARREATLGRVVSGLRSPASGSSRAIEDWDDGYKEFHDSASSRSVSRRSSGGERRWTSHRARRERPRYYDDEVDY